MPQITMDDLHPIVADRLNVPLDQLKREFDLAINKEVDPNRPLSDEVISLCLNEAWNIVADRLNVPPDQLKREYCTLLADWFGTRN